VFVEHEVMSSDGLLLYYRRYPGDLRRTAVLCLPGLTRNSRDFESLATHLSSTGGRTVIAPDFRGRGRSAYDSDWRNYRPEIYSRDVMALLNMAKLERVIVIGTSLGGIVGMLLARLSPDRVAGLVLNDIGPELEVTGMVRIATTAGTTRAATTWTEAAADARAGNLHVYPNFSEADWMTFAHRVYRKDRSGRIIRDVDPNVGRAIREPSGAPTSTVPDFWKIFHSLRGLPLLCLRGELSDFLSVETLTRMAAHHAGMQCREIPHRGHAPTLDEPESRVAIDTFIETL